MDTDLVRRAYAAYFRSADSVDQPAADISGAETHEGLDYVVLRNVNGTLAVYRVRPDGVLKRLKRWPVTIESPV